MVISKENKDFIDSLIDYYISESESYRQIAENFVPEIESVPDTAFGIITGCVYSGFLQTYQNQQENLAPIVPSPLPVHLAASHHQAVIVGNLNHHQ